MSAKKLLSAALCVLLVALTVCAGLPATAADERIGSAIWSVEAFTVGGGFLVEPTELPIYAGENAADQLLRLLRQSGLVCYFGGTADDAFYLAYIADGTSTRAKFNRYSGSGRPQNARELRLSPSIPAVLLPHLRDTMVFFDPDDYEKNWTGYLGEFVFTNGSGWMYTVNNDFPGVGFSDTFLSDGDVVRVQFTLAYGADIGGLGATGGNAPGVGNQPASGYYPVANKDALCKTICKALSAGSLSGGETKNAYADALAAMAAPDASQDRVDNAARALADALSKPSDVPPPPKSDEPSVAVSSAVTSEPSAPSETVSASAPPVSEPPDTPSEPPVSNPPETPSTPPEPDTPGDANDPPVPVSDAALSVADGILRWKKAENGSPADGFLLNDAFLASAGSTAGDWYPIGLDRLGISDNFDGYLAVLTDRIEERYREPGRLSAAKATEWHRIALAMLAAGGDPTHAGTDENGNPIDLIADGTYDRGKTAPLGRQGLNGWVWGLIALDSMRYDVPADACDTRDGMIAEILRQQLPDGGFALNGTEADPDMTAMVLQALAPYRDSDRVYAEAVKTVPDAIEDALACLSALQLDAGDFASWGTENVESTDQVLIALCCLGIDPLTDARFCKNGHTLLDGILRYRLPDGGFAHSFAYDPNNPTASPGESNAMAGEQTLLAMAALWRQQNGLHTLYDFRPEEDAEPQENATVRFDDADREAADSLPDTLTTAYEATVTSLLDKLLRSEDFDGKAAYLQKLTDAKATIAAIRAEIDALNAEIRETLYPFDRLTVRDRETVDGIFERCMALSEYDRTQIERFDDVQRAKTQIDGALRGRLLAVVLCVAAAGIAFCLVRRVRKRRKRRETEREELAARYETGEEP